MLWFEVVQGVIEPLVKLLLPQPIDNTEGKNDPQKIGKPAPDHVYRNSIVSNSIQDPRPPPGAQVDLWETRPQSIDKWRNNFIIINNKASVIR